MIKEIIDFTRAGREYNEDAHYICEDFGFVLDGATGMAGKKVSDAPSDANWFSNEWREYLKEALKDKTKTIREILREGIKVVDDKFMAIEGANELSIKPIAPLSLFRINGDEIELYSVGDTSIIVTFTNGKVKQIAKRDVDKIDNINIKRINKIAKEKNLDVLDAVPYMKEHLVNARLLSNVKGGYWSIGDTPEVLDHSIYKSIPLNKVKQIMVLSDGYSQVFDTFKIYTLKEFAKAIEEGVSVKKIYEALYNAQEEDNKANKYPRFKLRDDATIVVMKLETKSLVHS